ncbi:MAG: TonB-dependent receptor [Rhodothermales bacterium]|nr:TonB-dependent receptor [Rhodothermales bacterium]MBO6779824.1 TonB-dependent receptor [Rhodothermales bacterium]
MLISRPYPRHDYARPLLLAALALLLTAGDSRAQTGSAEEDSLRFYELSEIVVGGRPNGGRVAEAGSVRRVSLARIVRTDAPDVAGLTRLLPSAHLQTNSRGESLIYLRGGGERQVSVFLDGALLNVPWDNRVDLAAVPASVLGGMQVTQGASSVLYGTNVLGGVVNLSTRALEGDGVLSELTLAGGSGRFARVDGMHVRRRGPSSIIVAAGLNRQDGYTLGENTELPFNEGADGLRLNTDRRIAHGYARVSRRWTRSEGGLSVLLVDAAKGVAPEGHLDPTLERVRFWRYPDWRTVMLAGNFSMVPSERTRLRASAWGTGFSQRIDQFQGRNYASLEAFQEDRDVTVGTRISAERMLRGSLLRGAVNLLTSGHRQWETESGMPAGEDEAYRQHTASVGGEWAGGERVRWLVGGNVDQFATPRTAGKPGGRTFRAWGGTAALEADLNAVTTARVTLGRKVRFPTMRELFGTALNRFVVNESLRPESAILLDAGIRRVDARGHVELTAFLNRTRDTIDQTNVTVEGERLRQRINLEGSRVLGAEVVAHRELNERIELDASVTLTDPAVLDDPERSVLVEKPDVLALLGLSVKPATPHLLSVEAAYTGRAYGLDPDNSLVALPRVLQLNLRASTRTYRSSGLFMEFFARLDNLTDQSVFPQLGLPGPGRTFQLGVSLAY